MLLRAQRELGIDLANSYVIGDRYLDVDVAYAGGARSVLVMTGNGRVEHQKYSDLPNQPHFVADNLLTAVESIVSGAFA
jgi:D-glycero-D-manno-heptose 1,7-bisphosphate phosphatase